MRIAIVGGGPGGYEAALVAAELGAEVTLVDRQGMGGACVLTDAVPSKTLCSAASAVTVIESAPALGLTQRSPSLEVDYPKMVQRILWLVEAQSDDIRVKLASSGVTIVTASARFVDGRTIEADGARIEADAILVSTGSSPRELDTAKPDGARILNARQVYALSAVPEKLIIVGSGATGAEFAHAFNRLGSDVTLVSSRDRVLPGEDAEAARVLEDVFERRGVTILKNARATGATSTAEGVVVELKDGRTVEGSHVLMTVGQIPNTADLGLEAAGVRLGGGGEIAVNGVSRTNVPTIYAAGDVTGGMMLASTAAMQGRIAMWHALGQAVLPFNPDEIASTVFTDPEIATVGISEQAARDRGLPAAVMTLPFATNARAKMVALEDGFVKIVASQRGGRVLGGTVVAPQASDLIYPLSVAVHAKLGVAQLAQAFSIYPSFGGSIQEAARRLM
jgi:dihydrolipoamide dehydrogenase